MRYLPLLLLAVMLPGCAKAPAPLQAQRPRAAAPAAKAASSLAADALGAYTKQIEEVMKAVASKDAKRIQAAVEKLLKTLVDALRGISKALRTDGTPSSALDGTLSEVDALWAKYEAIPGELTGEKAALVQEMEQKLVASLVEQLAARP
jgi:small-conductance mechanosensitive channel